MGYEWTKRPEYQPGSAYGVQTASTTATVLTNRGISTVVRKSTAGTSTQLYTLAAPTRAGMEKVILCTNATSSRSVRITAVSGGFQTTAGSTGATKMTFKTREWGAYLISLSTKSWAVSWLSSRPGVLS